MLGEIENYLRIMFSYCYLNFQRHLQKLNINGEPSPLFMKPAIDIDPVIMLLFFAPVSVRFIIFGLDEQRVAQE